MLLIVLLFSNSAFAVNLYEPFTHAGKPKNSSLVWSYRAQLEKKANWHTIIPGDGFAYLKVSANKRHHQAGIKWPFQMLILKSLGPNHSIEIRAKNMLINGVASFIFSYSEVGGKLDEMDLEMTKLDSVYGLQPDGASALRMNVWHRAPLTSDTAQRSIPQAAINVKQQPINLDDGLFHLYRMDWYQDKVAFYIDNVKQGEFVGDIPITPADINIGVRHMSWTGKLGKTTESVVIDWLRITEL